MKSKGNRRRRGSQSNSLARNIVMHASRNAWDVGHPLREGALAESFNVSRTPINRALQQLATLGIAEHQPNRGFFLRKPVEDALQLVKQDLGTDDVYLRLARDALNWGSGHTLTISDLVTAYGEPRGRVQRACDRAATEGWLEKGSGYKWTVRLGIASEEDYARFYRFRETMEPAAVLEPGFEIDTQEFATLLSLQKRIANGEFENLSAVDLFEINTELHETIVSWSGNHFFLDALKRANASRRVIEYTKVLETERIDIFAHEHVEILETLERGARKKAARLLQAHVATARNVKARSITQSRERPAEKIVRLRRAHRRARCPPACPPGRHGRAQGMALTNSHAVRAHRSVRQSAFKRI